MPNVCIIEIKVADMDKGRTFYEDALGMAVKMEKYLPDVLVMEHDGVDLILHVAEKPVSIDYPNSAQSLLIFAVDDIEAAAGRLRKAKAEIMDGPRPSPPGTFLAFRDPFGNVHGLMQLNSNG
ncbi:MAG: hypothetical protein EPO32_09840 [Anaerolineae bacterium]|nr:MAG: hypothetical protein EPO32_09840 [Anaerolineae bacterium]